MPLHDLKCKQCGYEFERMIKMGAENPKCPECQKATRKLIGLSSFRLKGAGWYKDGYQKKT